MTKLLKISSNVKHERTLEVYIIEGTYDNFCRLFMQIAGFVCEYPLFNLNTKNIFIVQKYQIDYKYD